jgi:hypothetical protein
MVTNSKIKLALAEWLIGEAVGKQVDSIQKQLADLQLRVRALSAQNAKLAVLLRDYCFCDGANTCEICRAISGEEFHVLDA